jgi:predicted 3-demethylubiquinone-9 3-methyltransferase (glyoxalase superfamily)
MQKITPCLWFDTHAEEAMNRLTTTFQNSKITTLQRYPEMPIDVPSQQNMAGKVLTGIFELDGYQFMCLDGGPMFKFTPAVSFFVNCETEAELDKIWGVLSEDATTLMPLQAYPFSEKFGWLQDKYGVAWQVNLGARPQKITPYFTFVGEQFGKAEEAINFYTSLFENSGVDNILRYDTDEDGGKVGAIKQALFRLNNQEFRAIESNFDHKFSFNESISFYVECDTQEEVDHFWNKMSAHPDSEQCGWLKDKYGVSWQIVPKILGELLNHPDPEKARNVLDVMLQMKKMDIDALKAAAT